MVVVGIVREDFIRQKLGPVDFPDHARRIFWTGANPFAMNYENLKLWALTVRDYLIKCQTMAMFASVRDIKSKEVWQLKKLIYQYLLPTVPV